MENQKIIENLKKELHNSFDFAERNLTKNGVQISFVYLKSMTDNLLFSQSIFEPIRRFEGEITFDSLLELNQSNDVKEIKEDEVVEKVLTGSVVIFASNGERFLAVDILKFNSRAPAEPPTSSVIMGPREGFTEDLKTNISLLRKRFYGNDLVLENTTVGKLTKTKVVVAFLDGIADKKIVKEIKKRIEKIDIDGVIDAHYLIAMICDRPNSVLKQVGSAEKPDIVSAKLLEGRVAILVDNSPIVLTLPFVFLEDMQSSNDYYTNHYYASLLRTIRLIGLILAVLGPGAYVAMQLFHYSVLPLKYLITIADLTQQVPFTPFLEIMFILLLFQILYEVSLRLPSYLGLATSIVGALILGDTGVKAGLISPPSVIVIAIAKIALYTVPEQYSQITLFQFIFIWLGASLGLLGLVGGCVYMIAYMNSVDSFGSPYLAPFSPFILSDNKDALYKATLKDMKLRPKSIQNVEGERINVDDQK